METLKRILIPVGIGLGIFAILGTLGTTAFLYREASEIHPALGWGVLGLLAGGLLFLVVVPASRVLRLPKPIVRPASNSGPEWSRFLVRYAARTLRSGHIQDFEGLDTLRTASSRCESGKDIDQASVDRLEEELRAAIEHLDQKANRIIHTHAAAVFVATGASQSGRLDTGIVLSTQIRLIKEIAEVYYQRPGPRELWKLYSHVGTSAFVAGEIQDSELLAVLGAPVSAALSGFVPLSGTTPLVSLLVNSLLDGSANALITLRVGILARRFCGVQIEESPQALSRSVSLEAVSILSGVVAGGAKRIANATRRLVVQGATQGPQTAVKGVADASTTVASGIVRMASRAGAKAVRASQEMARQVAGIGKPRSSSVGLGEGAPGVTPLSATPDAAEPSTLSEFPSEADPETGEKDPVLADAVRFWDRVAEIFAP